jgi:methyl-accepting chemotaxis protein
MSTGAGSTGAGGFRETVREFIRYTPNGQSIPDEMWESRHRKVVISTLAHLPFLLALGLYSGTESLVTGATIPKTPLPQIVFGLGLVTALSVAAYVQVFRRRVRTMLSVASMITATAALVFFSGGFIEAHFHFFVIMAVVAVYEDWLPFAFGIAYVALQHGWFGTINPTRVYNHTAAINNPWAWGLVHAVFVLMLAVALMANWYSTEKSRERADVRMREAEQKGDEIADLEQKQREIERARAEAERTQQEAERHREEVQQLNDHLQAKADEFSETMERAANGDLTTRLDPDSDSEPMTRIAHAFNDMMADVEGTVQNIQSFAVGVSRATEEAGASAEEIAETSETVGESIESISRSADEQRDRLEVVSREMSDLSASVEEVASSAEAVTETAGETAAVAEDGKETARAAIESAREAQSAIDTTVENVDRLEERMRKIGDIVDLIGDIAEQTNMLALNANIEAARADGSGTSGTGDGFAVVADEVKQLAEETRDSATEIENLIAETQAQTERTVEEAQTAESHVEEAVEAIGEAVDAFETVAENAQETDDGIREIRDAADDQAASTQQAVATVEEVSEFSQRTADEATEVSAAAQEQTAAVSQVNASIQTLIGENEDLQQLLAKFDVSNESQAAHIGATAATEAGTDD